MDDSSSSLDAATTAVEAAAAAAVLLRWRIARWIVEKKTRRNYFQRRHWKMPVVLERNLVYFVLDQFHPMKTMSQPLCFDIEY